MQSPKHLRTISVSAPSLVQAIGHGADTEKVRQRYSEGIAFLLLRGNSASFRNHLFLSSELRLLAFHFIQHALTLFFAELHFPIG